MTAPLTSDPAPLRIDASLPNYDFRADYQIRINSLRSRVYECLLHVDLSELWLMRLLMTLRTGKKWPSHPAAGDLRQRLQGTGFVMLNEIPNDEIVIGVAGRFWRPDGGRCMDLVKADFIDFARTGYAKAAWNFKLRAASSESESTILSTANQNPVPRCRSLVEVSHLLEFVSAILRPVPQSNSETSEDHGGIALPVTNRRPSP